MLADFLYYLYPYQIFKSVFFRGGMTYLTTFFLINIFMPFVIRSFRRHGITSDFNKTSEVKGPYRGATPIMGGLVLIPAIMISIFLWAWINHFTISLLIIMLSYGLIGGIDDIAKIINKRKILQGKAEKKSWSDKADGIPGSIRILLEILITLLVIGGLYWFLDGLDGRLHIPMIPMKTWFPELPSYIFIPFIVVVIVGGANAVNLTDGLDSLASVPIVTSTLFVVGAAYIAGDVDWSERLKILYVSDDIKEVAIFGTAIIAAIIAFLKFNSPPASIYMGDIGSLGLGAAVCTMFFFIKAELYLPIVGWGFVAAALSTIMQRLWFKIALLKKGRDWAEKNRLFYRAPYHHHKQVLMTYREDEPEIHSIWHHLLQKIGLSKIADEDKYLSQDQVNNKVIWTYHLRAISLLVIAVMIYFKVR